MSRDETFGREHLATRRAAMLRVFRQLSVRWPRLFAIERADDLMPIWLQAVTGIDTDLLETAALRFCAEYQGQYADPPDFSKFARQMQRDASALAMPRTVERPPETKDGDRVDLLGRRAYRTLGSWRKVADVWSLLWLTATTNEERQNVRDGHVPDDLFAMAVDKIAAGYVPASTGPMGRVAV